MIKKLVKQMLTAQVLSALTVSLCLLIDSIMISRFLGVKAIAAYGFANPILLVIGAVASMLSAGVQVVCSRSLGRGSQEETNAGYSSALAFGGAVSLVFVVVVVLLRNPLATMLGAVESPEIHGMTSDYLAGFSIGAPGSIGALILVPFMQMAGRSGLLIAAVIGMTITDIGLDLLSILVFNGGMFGMGLASSLSYYVALIIGGFYFLSPKCVFKFRRRGVTWKKIAELLRGGVPTVFTMASTIVLVYAINTILQHHGGSDAVAAFTIIMSLGNSSNCISTGMGGVALTLGGILYNEEDRTGLRELLSLLTRYAVIMGFAAAGIMVIIAPWAVKLFIPDVASVSYKMAVQGVRLFSIGLIPCCVTNALKSLDQATGRVGLTEIISIIEGAVMPILVALAFGRMMGTDGVWLYFLGGELLTLLLIVGSIWIWKKKVTSDPEDFLLLDDNFGVAQDHLLEIDIHNLQEVSEAAQRVTDFCRFHGQNEKMTNHIVLCMEEMASNTVEHGFAKAKKAKKEVHCSMRLQNKEDRWVLRFRDDCSAFDPVHYVPNESAESGLGIKIVLRLADEVRYTYSLNLNNLTIIFRGQHATESK